jgi:hypothetical protein
MMTFLCYTYFLCFLLILHAARVLFEIPDPFFVHVLVGNDVYIVSSNEDDDLLNKPMLLFKLLLYLYLLIIDNSLHYSPVNHLWR